MGAAPDPTEPRGRTRSPASQTACRDCGTRGAGRRGKAWDKVQGRGKGPPEVGEVGVGRLRGPEGIRLELQTV